MSDNAKKLRIMTRNYNVAMHSLGSALQRESKLQMEVDYLRKKIDEIQSTGGGCDCMACQRAEASQYYD